MTNRLSAPPPDPASLFSTSLRVTLAVLGVIVCAGTLPEMSRLFTPRQMSGSSMPLLVMLGVPALASLAVSSVRPNSVNFTIAWVVAGSAAYVAGDAYTILHDAGDSHTLWPIELAIFTVLGAGSLIAGAALGRWLMKGRGRGPGAR